MKAVWGVIAILLAVIAGVVWLAADKRLSTTAAETGPATSVAPVVNSLASIRVVKSRSCGCCGKWVDHLRSDGFAVNTHDVDDVSPFKQQAGITPALASCHTAFVSGYVIEGHVPADDIHRLLTEKPDAVGLTVPGMPIGSPGMEIEGRPADTYEVLLIHRDGSTSVFSRHGP